MTLHKSKNLKKFQKKSVHQGHSDDMRNYFSALKASLFLKCEMGNHEILNRVLLVICVREFAE